MVQDESIDDLVEKAENESQEIVHEFKTSEPKVHLVVVACEGKSKSAIDEAKNMIKSAILLSTEKKIKVCFPIIVNVAQIMIIGDNFHE